MKRNNCQLGLGIILTVFTLAAGTARAAITIDNFEEGTNNLTQTTIGSSTSNQTGLATGNVVGGSRQAILALDISYGATPSVSSTIQPVDAPIGADDHAQFSANSDAEGTLILAYGTLGGFGALNSNFLAGGNTGLGLVYLFADSTSTVTVEFDDGANSQPFAQALPSALSGSTNVFLFSNYGLINFADVDGVKITIDGVRAGDYKIALTELNSYDIGGSVPEPTIFGLIALGGALVGLRRRR